MKREGVADETAHQHMSDVWCAIHHGPVPLFYNYWDGKRSNGGTTTETTLKAS